MMSLFSLNLCYPSFSQVSAKVRLFGSVRPQIGYFQVIPTLGKSKAWLNYSHSGLQVWSRTDIDPGGECETHPLGAQTVPPSNPSLTSPSNMSTCDYFSHGTVALPSISLHLSPHTITHTLYLLKVKSIQR